MADPPATPVLPDYDGRQVASTTISVTNAGDGLSKGMAITPQVLGLRSKGYLVLEFDVAKHTHKDLAGTEFLVLEQVLKAGTAVLVDADLVKPLIDQQAERILQAEEERKGLSRLPYNDEGELGLAHARGDHAGGRAEGCPVCDLEADAELAEAEPPKPTPIKGRRKRAAPSVTE